MVRTCEQIPFLGKKGTGIMFQAEGTACAKSEVGESFACLRNGKDASTDGNRVGRVKSDIQWTGTWQ